MSKGPEIPDCLYGKKFNIKYTTKTNHQYNLVDSRQCYTDFCGAAYNVKQEKSCWNNVQEYRHKD